MPDQSLTPLSDADRLDQYEQGLNVSDLRSTIMSSPLKPDAMATQTRAAQQLGTAPAAIDGLHEQAQTAIRANNMAAVAQAHPVIGAWAAANPRQAVAASDDHKSLGMLGQAWDWFSHNGTWSGDPDATPITSAMAQGAGDISSNPISRLFDWIGGNKAGDTSNAVMSGGLSGAGTVVRGASHFIASDANAGIPVLNKVAAGLTGAGQDTDAAIQKRNWVTKGGAMVGGVVPFAAAGEFAPVVMGASGAGQQVEAAQAAGKPVSSAGMMLNAAVQATIGHVFGLVGKYAAPAVGDAVAGAVGRSLARTSGGLLTGNIVGQAATEGAGSLSSYATRMIGSAGLGVGMSSGSNLITQQTVNPKQSIMEGTGDSAVSMVALDLLTHGLHAALGNHAEGDSDPTGRLTQTGQAILPDIMRAIGGVRDAQILDGIDKAASDSTFKARDPEGYSALIKYLGDQHGVDQVYVSPEAIRSYQQSDSYDRFNDPFQAHEDAIHEAEVSGGDVALPTEFVLGDLAGTGAYKAIKDSVRLRADGMTGGEAKETIDRLDETAKATFDGLNEQDRAATKEQDTRAALVERLTGEIQNAGHTPRNASTMAELIAQKASTRAARLGKTLQPGDFDTRIVRVLPPSLEAARKADNLDLAINAMRKGKPAESQSGKSLLQFIADRGGINDSGGDLKAMGIDQWHRDQPGRKKLLTDFDPAQGSFGGVSGEGDFGHDTTLRAATEAGYFPELAGQEPGELDTNHLHTAISDELSGRPRYAEAPKFDHMRAAGDDLRRMIENEGRDPSGMSDKDIRAMVDDVASRPASDGRAFEQSVQSNVSQDTAPDEGLGPASMLSFVPKDGKPGISVNTDDGAFAEAVYRDADGKAQGVVRMPISDEGREINPEVSAYVSPDARRSGVATKLYDALRDAGHDVDGLSGTGDVTPNGAAFINNRRALNQSADDTPRGRILLPADGWGSGPATIELFHKANLSTLVHELGHQWLEELRFDAGHPEASDQLKADWGAVEKWFADQGHPITDGTIPVEAHELFARGIERYMMEGKAPSEAAKGIFEKIRGWMVNVYRSVAALNSPISPELRQVFDRMIATDDEIAAKDKGLAMQAGFDDLSKLGMSDAEAEAYRSLTNSARDEANSDLLAKTMATIRRQHTAAWNDERNGVKAEETARIEETPLFSAIRMMKENPVDRDWITDRMGDDAPGLMPKSNRRLMKEGGAHPDDIAEMAGFNSGEEMLHTLIGAERANREAKASGDPRTMRERIIDQATDTEMSRRHGDDPFNDGSIEDEAIAAVNEKMGGKLLDAQLSILGAKSGNVAALYSIARAWARDKVRSGVIASEAMASAVQRHTRAVAKGGREAEKAILAGKWDEAFAAKQRQMVASALLAETQEAHAEATKASDALAKIAKRKTMKSVDQDYLDQAHALLDDVQLGPRSQKSIDRQGKWAEWSAQREAEGYDVVVPATFEATINGTHWSRLTVDQFLGLKDAVDQVMHLGKLKQSLLDGQEQRTWDAIYSEAEAAGAHIDGPVPRSMADLHSPGILDSIKHGLASADAQLVRMETVFDWLDGGDSNGVFNRIAFKPVSEAQTRESGMLKDYLGSTKDLIEAVPAKDRARWDDRVTTPWTDPRTNEPMVLTKQQIIAMALNVGNEGNLQRLTDGYRLNEGAVQDFLNRNLTGGEWKFVQGVWDHIGTLWPQIEGLERRVNGVAPDKVESRSFDTPHGSMRGGYYPAIYDSTLDTRAEQNSGKTSDLMEAKYTRATTRASATKERSDQVQAPILLDMGVINRHLAEVIHDITHREAIMQAWKFLGNERVQSTVKAALGPEYAKQFQPWVKSVANSMAMDRAGNEGFGKWIRAARMNVTMVGLGLRATTIMVHTSGLAAGASVIGEKAMAHGLSIMARNPVASVNHVLEQSPEIRAHLEHYERDIGTMIDSMDKSKATTRAVQLVRDGQKFALHGIGWMVQRVSVPVWIGAYDKAIGEGLAHEDAKFAADKAVRYSLGSGAPKDLAAVQRSSGKWGEAIKMLTMFYTAMGSQYQRQRSLGRDIAGNDDRRPRDVPKLASRAFWGVAMVPLWDAVIRMAIGGSGPEKDEWWSTWLGNRLIANQLAPIPGVRDLIEPALNKLEGHYGRNPSITPLQGIYDSVSKSLDDAGALIHGNPTKTLTKDTMMTAGYLTGMVPGQMAAATQYLVDVGDGSAHPHGVRDWINGLSSGHDRKK